MIKEILAFILIIILIFSLVCAIIIPLYYGEKQMCKEQSNLMNVSWTYGYFTECMIKINNTFIPMDNYRFLEE